MVNYLLCKSELFQNTATAVVDMLGGVGEAFLNSCSPKRLLPHFILHGMTDPIITYDRDTQVDGSNFISTREWGCVVALCTSRACDGHHATFTSSWCCPAGIVRRLHATCYSTKATCASVVCWPSDV